MLSLFNLENSSMGTLSISTNGYNITKNEGMISVHFSRVTSEIKKEVWSIYQSKITAKLTAEQLDSKTCITKLEEIIKKIRPSYEGSTTTVSPTAQECFEKAKSLKTIIKEIFLAKITDSNSFVLHGDCFNTKIDKAERLVAQVFENLFEDFYKQNNYEEAFEVAKKIKNTRQGKQAILKLVVNYVGQKNHLKAAQLLDAIGVTIKSKEIQAMLDQIKPEEASVLISSLRAMKNSKVRGSLVSELIEKFLEEGKTEIIELITLIPDDYGRREAYIKVVNNYINKDDIPNAIKNIPFINDSYYQRESYIKIVDHYINQRQINASVKMIPSIRDSYYEKENYIKVVKFYKNVGDMQNALDIIACIDDSYSRNQQYGEAIDWYLTNGKVKEAKAIIPLINSSYERDKYKAKFFKYI